MKRITVVDIAIVLLVIAVLLGGYYYLSSQRIIQSGDSDDSYTFDLCISGIEKNVVDEIQEGDVVFDSTKLIELGVIKNIKVSELTDIYPDVVEGGYKTQTVDHLYRVIITVGTKNASNNNGIIYVNNYELFIGKTCYIRGNNFAGSASVWGMGEWEAEQ